MNAFKRITSLILLLCLVFSLAACGIKPAETDPSTASTAPTASTTPTTPDLSKQKVLVDTEGMTELQKAIVITAESYFLRGKYAQYDQYSLTAVEKGNVNRRLHGIMAPEDYTSQHYGYTDCSSFVYDVYKFALGMSISDPANTKTYCAGSVHTILSETPKTSGFSKLSAEELAAKEKTFLDTLQPGDIIAYRAANGNSGHAMLYVGNNMMIHSTGSTYDYTAGADKTEPNGTYYYDSINALLMPGNKRYLFDKSIYIIMRPLNSFEGEIPAHTRSRMEVMRGMVAEKLCSHSYGQTVNPGDTMTFTFRIKNRSSITKTVTVTDTVPAGTTYVSGAHTVSGKTLSWTVPIPAGAAVDLTYSVTVDAATAPGTYIQSESFVSGISVNCQRVLVANTLTEAQQNAIKDAIKAFTDGELKGIALANTIYERACGKTLFTQQDTDAIWADIVSPYNTSDVILDSNKPLAAWIAPRLYGGRLMAETNTAPAATQYRTRLVTKSQLVVGDVVLADGRLYIFNGLGLFDLATAQSGGLTAPESLLKFQKFVVLRPSMAF